MSYDPPVSGVAWRGFVSLRSMANPGSMQANPTLASGDVKVSKDGGAFANLTTLPAVTPAAGVAVQVDASATEMTADNVVIAFIDQTSPKEWADLFLLIQTTAAGYPANVKYVNDVLVTGTGASGDEWGPA